MGAAAGAKEGYKGRGQGKFHSSKDSLLRKINPLGNV